jgi:hypothetical protein
MSVNSIIGVHEVASWHCRRWTNLNRRYLPGRNLPARNLPNRLAVI